MPPEPYAILSAGSLGGRSRFRISLFTKTLGAYLALALLVLGVPALVRGLGIAGAEGALLSGRDCRRSGARSGIRPEPCARRHPIVVVRSALEVSQGDLSRTVARERPLRLGEDEIRRATGAIHR